MKNYANTSENNENGHPDNNLDQLFLEALSNLYNVEQQLTQALPKMIEAAQSAELKSALESHLGETEGHVARLEEVADAIGEELQTRTCRVMEALVAEASALIKKQSGRSAVDAAIIAAAQKAEHIEIASYGTVHAWAQQLGQEDAADLLAATLDEEKAANETLSRIARSSANRTAMARQP